MEEKPDFVTKKELKMRPFQDIYFTKTNTKSDLILIIQSNI